MMSLRRSLPCWLLLGALGLGCAVNPVTGKKELALVSESQEIQMGKDYDPQIVSSMGLYEDEDLAAYVSGLGLAMAESSERPHLPWTFRLVDDAVVNAFAVPGGYIYVTRGILAALNSEAELVGVLGHEIGHITARHSVSQMTRSQLQQLGVGLGVAFIEGLEDYAGILLAGLEVLNLRYSREDESQSDELGFKYMSRAGYDPSALVGVFQSLALVSGGEGTRLPEWQLTHPYPERREERIESMVSASGIDYSAYKVERKGYLERLDGLVHGENPREGYFEGAIFHHPDLAFRLEFPAAWKGVNQRSAVGALAPEEDALLILTLDEAATPQDASAAFVRQEGVAAEPAQRTSIHGLAASRVGFTAQVEGGALRGEATFIGLDEHVFQVLAYGTTESWPRHAGAARSAAESFRRETDRSVLDIQPARIEIVKLSRAMTFAEFLKTYPSSIPDAEVAAINRVGASDRLAAGTWMKRVRAPNR